MLEIHLSVAGFQTKQAENDPDFLIVKTAIDTASESTTSIIVEGVDLLVFMTQLTPTDKNVLLSKPGKNKVPEQWFETKSFAHAKLKSIITFLRAFCGCDNT